MKEQVITFKVGKDLQEALSLIPNKSEFIRNSILESLGNKCPLCGGSGILNQPQKSHLEDFLKHHHLEKCGDCEQVHIRCEFEQEST